MAVLYGTQSDGSLIPVQADSQGRLVAELAQVDQSVQGDLLVTGDVQMGSLNGGQLAGFRNWIINGSFTVNQRGGTRTPGAGVYGFDRWKGHASGLEQIVEALPAGEYTLSWSGGGNGIFGGTTASSPITATVTAGDTSVIVPTDATLVQLEPGPVATPFESRPLVAELALSQRFYTRVAASGSDLLATGYARSSTDARFTAFLPVPMREPPAFLRSAPATFSVAYLATGAACTNLQASATSDNRTIGFIATTSGATAGQAVGLVANGECWYAFDAEL